MNYPPPSAPPYESDLPPPYVPNNMNYLPQRQSAPNYMAPPTYPRPVVYPEHGKQGTIPIHILEISPGYKRPMPMPVRKPSSNDDATCCAIIMAICCCCVVMEEEDNCTRY